MSPAKTAELIEMLFGLWTPVGHGNRVLDGGTDPHGRGNLEGDAAILVKYRDAVLSAVQKRLNQLRCLLGMDSDWPKEVCASWGAY